MKPTIEDWHYLRDKPEPKPHPLFAAIISAGFAIGIGVMIGMALCGVGL